MKQNKSKCNCAQRGITCGRKLSLIKREKNLPDITEKEKKSCPKRSVLADT